MKCPRDIAKVILEILELGILRIRSAGWAGNSRQCAAEADHIHNLPSLLIDYTPEKLRYYFEAERTSFIVQCAHSSEAEVFQSHWDRLAELLEQQSVSSS